MPRDTHLDNAEPTTIDLTLAREAADQQLAAEEAVEAALARLLAAGPTPPPRAKPPADPAPSSVRPSRVDQRSASAVHPGPMNAQPLLIDPAELDRWVQSAPTGAELA